MVSSRQNIVKKKLDCRSRKSIFSEPYGEIIQELYRIFISGKRETRNEYCIFLCGGSNPNQDDLRRKIGKKIQEKKSKYRYSIHYPEEMFIELILGHHRKDLLSLENILAESSHAIAILLNSPGTFTELGAFSNHPQLRNKLIIIADPKYKRNKSFINLGPLRYLQKETKSKIHFISFDTPSIPSMADAISDSCRSFDCPPHWSLSNPLLSIEFYLSIIFVFDPIPKSVLINAATSLENEHIENVILSAETVVNGLINNGQIICNSGFLSTSQRGLEMLLYSNRTKVSIALTKKTLTNLRFKALNLIYRKNKERIRVEHFGT